MDRIRVLWFAVVSTFVLGQVVFSSLPILASVMEVILQRWRQSASSLFLNCFLPSNLFHPQWFKFHRVVLFCVLEMFPQKLQSLQYLLCVCVCLFFAFFPGEKITFITDHPKTSAMCKTNHWKTSVPAVVKTWFLRTSPFLDQTGGVQPWNKPSQVLARIISMYGRFREAQNGEVILFGCFVVFVFFSRFFSLTYLDGPMEMIVTIVSKLGV